MIIDCDDCAMRDLACGDCVVTVLLGGSYDEFDATERRAMASLAGAGLIPPLRMVPLSPTRFNEATRPPDMTESA